MRVIRLWAFVLFFTVASCAANRIHSSYQIYPLRAPSAATSFSKLGLKNAKILVDSYVDENEAPIRLTATDGTGLEMRGLRVRTVVAGPLAFTELKMSFHNPRKREIEGRFEIVLPDNASVARLAMKLGKRWQEAEVVARRRGQEVYESYLHKQVDPVLLEASVGNRFRARVYPIPAKGDKEIIISYSEQLPASGDYRLLLAGLPSIRELDVDVHYSDKRERFIKANFVGEKDLVVATGNASGVAVRAEELVMMRWVPEQKKNLDVPSAITVLIDSSASAAGVYGKQVRALASLASKLASTYGDGLELEVASYDNQVTPIFKGLAKDYGTGESDVLMSHGALGATNVEAALQWASKRSGRLLFIGDGIATSEARSWADLRGALNGWEPERVDALALATTRNQPLLRELVQTSGRRAGVLLASAQDSGDWVQHLGYTAPEEVTINVAGASWIWPEKLRATRPGEAVTAFAKFEVAGAKRLDSIQIEQQRGGKSETVTLPVVDGSTPLVQRQWAEVQLQNLLKLQRERRSDVRQAQIESLSHRFRILTPVTSFLMLESEADYARFGIDRNDSGTVLMVDATGLRTVGKRVSEARDWQRESLVTKPFVRDRGGAESEDGSASMSGVVRDKNTAELLPGVTIVITSVERKNNYNAMTDGNGSFKVSNLPVGTYSVLLIYGDTKTSYDSIRVQPGATAKIFAKLDLSQMGSEIVTIRGRALIDTTRTTQGIVIGRDFTRNLPVPGRTFESALSTAAGAQDDGVGVSFSGSSSMENQYVVDGVNTTGLGYGNVGSSSGSNVKIHREKQLTSVKRPVKDSSDIRKFRRIRSHLAANALPRALRHSLTWYASSPANLLAITALGESLEAAGHYTMAARAYASILDVYPSRADMHRVAAGYLGRLGPLASELREDALTFAHAARPDHVHGIRLLAMQMAISKKEEAAIKLLLKTLAGPIDRLRRLEQIRQLMRQEIGIIAAAWLAREPGKAGAIRKLLAESGIMVPMEAERYAVLSWESDVARLDLEVSRANGDKAVEGTHTHIGEIGYGPEAFALEEEPSDNLKLSAVFSQQAMTGYAFAQMQVIRLDDKGQLEVETRPFVALEAKEIVAVGGF